MQRAFDKELGEINTELLKMATMTENAIYKSVEALKKMDKDLAKTVVLEDKEINKLELKIEEMAINLLARRQPMAIDLRFITTGMKINAELERIADLAVNIAQRAKDLAASPFPEPVRDINLLSNLTIEMVKDAIDSFVNRNDRLAQKVILRDPEADDLRDKIYKELIDDYIIKGGETAAKAVELILIARHLERMCDHTTYIALDVIYMVQAKVLRHNIGQLEKEVGRVEIDLEGEDRQ